MFRFSERGIHASDGLLFAMSKGTWHFDCEKPLLVDAALDFRRNICVSDRGIEHMFVEANLHDLIVCQQSVGDFLLLVN